LRQREREKRKIKTFGCGPGPSSWRDSGDRTKGGGKEEIGARVEKKLEEGTTIWRICPNGSTISLRNGPGSKGKGWGENKPDSGRNQESRVFFIVAPLFEDLMWVDKNINSVRVA